MNTFKLVFSGRQRVTDDTIKKIKDYVHSLYEETIGQELDIHVIKTDTHNEVQITITPHLSE